MCIIAVKKRGIPLPADIMTIIRSCWASNSHGAGFMIKRHAEEAVTFEKGFMLYSDFVTAFKNLEVKQNDEFVMHFRIATDGSRGADMTHPFVCSNETKEVSLMKGTVKKPVMCHNGIIRTVGTHKIYSDSFLFARDILGKYDVSSGKRATKKWRKKFSIAISGQKICIMYPDQELELLGRYVYSRGMFFSNSGYKSYGHINTAQGHWNKIFNGGGSCANLQDDEEEITLYN